MITYKNKIEIEKMREGGKILAFVLSELEKMAKPGISLLALEKHADTLINLHKAMPSFKGYRDYPAILCTSLNEEVVHCIPNKRILCEGDIISIDCGIKYKNFFTDSALTVAVGDISEQAQKLLIATQQSLYAGINQVKPANTVGDIGFAVQQYAETRGFSVVRTLVGHGVGYGVHEDPRIPNYGKIKTGAELKPGMAICIEPMVNIGGAEVEFSDDGWRVTTKDKSLSAHFEHTIVVTNNGYEILTKRENEII
ncbi:MAG: type I methionyl aminopeptidase [Patescibacteria group bacterium]